MMRRFLGPALAVLLLLVTAGFSSAETLTHARIGFTAERILVLNGHRYVGRMWYRPGEERQEQQLPGLTPIFLLSDGSAVAEIVVPQLHTVAELPLPKGFSLLRHPSLLSRPIGRERVDGLSATVYRIDAKSAAGRVHGRLWLSAEGIPVKAEGEFESPGGRVTTLSWRLRDIRIGPQAAALFRPPPKYARLTAQALAPLLGLKPVKAPRLLSSH